MASIIEHFSSANKTTLENNVTFLTQLTNQCLSGIQKIVALNVDTIATSATITLPQDNSTQMQKVTNYSRQLINIATNTQAEINTTAEAHIAQKKTANARHHRTRSQNCPARQQRGDQLCEDSVRKGDRKL